jgi:hypothetical protein
LDPQFIRALTPVLLFWGAERWLGLSTAIGLAAAWAVGDLAYTRWRRQPIDRLTLLSTGLIVVLGGVTAAGADERVALYTPVIGDAVVAGALGIPLLRGGSPLVDLVEAQRPDEPIGPDERTLLDRFTAEFALLMLAHGALTVAAVWWYRDAWSFVTGPGQLLMIAALIARVWLLARA